jgi:DNA invertase Pin-like site-specific DNA recombinase
MRVGIYARVSTVIAQSPEIQLSEMREYTSRRGWEIFGEYVDHGFSGAIQSRPELNRLMADAHMRHFDVVLCWKVDRFGRSLKHLVNALADLDSHGVAFVSLRDNLDFSTPSGRLMFQIIGAMAEFERSLIQERVRAGLRNAKLKGKILGRPRRIVSGDEMTRLREQRGKALGRLGKRLMHRPVRFALVCCGRVEAILEILSDSAVTPSYAVAAGDLRRLAQELLQHQVSQMC